MMTKVLERLVRNENAMMMALKLAETELLPDVQCQPCIGRFLGDEGLLLKVQEECCVEVDRHSFSFVPQIVRLDRLIVVSCRPVQFDGEFRVQCCQKLQRCGLREESQDQ